MTFTKQYPITLLPHFNHLRRTKKDRSTLFQITRSPTEDRLRYLDQPVDILTDMFDYFALKKCTT